MSDKSYKHYQFLQEKKKRQKEKAQAEFDAMFKQLNNPYPVTEEYLSDRELKKWQSLQEFPEQTAEYSLYNGRRVHK